MTRILETVLLLALPASGKSEVRRYIEHVDPARRAADFRMGPSVQLDDYPYVHAMRRIDDELVKLGRARVFFLAPDRPFQDARHWGTLIELVNEDHADVLARNVVKATQPSLHLLQRIDAAGAKAGIPSFLAPLDDITRGRLAHALDAEARGMLEEKNANLPATLEGKTLVIEFARGGPEGASMPLPEPLGYAYSLSRLSDAILESATILYIWVTPEESRRKNRARTDPNDPGSILHHGVPEEVMRKDYGCDDIEWLVAQSGKSNAVSIRARGRTHLVPIARFDNRVDKTSFLRDDPAAWRPADVAAVHEGLRSAIAALSD